MIFGLDNTYTSFKDYINKILFKKLKIFIILYLNNILMNIKYIRQDQKETV